MQLTVTVVVVLVVIARACRGEIVIANPSRDDSTPSIVDDLVNIVASCYGDRIEVGLIGHPHDELARTLSTKHLIPVVLIDSLRSHRRIRKKQFHHKLHVFVIDNLPPELFVEMINEQLKLSIWWNHMASFFIINRVSTCEIAEYYLNVAWSADLLNANVLCDHPRDGRVIVSFNPFTSEAPTPWMPVHVSAGLRNHPFTLLVRRYRRNSAICANLNFDKTKYLGGYPLTVLGSPLGHEVRHSPTPGSQRFWRRQDRIFDILSRILNVKLVFINLEEIADISKYTSAFNNVRRTTCDMTYPFEEFGLVIVTQFRGHKSQLRKILSVVDVDSRIGLAIVYFITLIFLKFLVRQNLISALLNLVRITCNTGFTNLTNCNASRVYLTCLLFFVVTMQGIYQGNLAALLTQTVSVRQVETMQDLAELDYVVYGPVDVTNAIDNEKLMKRFTVVNENRRCLAYVANNSSAACLSLAYDSVLDQVREFNLHISSKFVEIHSMSFLVKLDWHLQRKIGMTITKFVESGILEPWNDTVSPPKLSDYQIDEEVKKNKDFKMIELGEVTFAFVILGIGLVCATITFIAELAMQYRFTFANRQTR